MYNNFFGFKERPFQLVPNPAYLFLSKTHEEALAHLTYAISQGDGFVEITGEVGTGKTTLCRVVLESLDKDTEAAYIFNPKLDSIQLLKAINQEFEIPCDDNNIKDLINHLNNFLVKKKSEGKKIVIIIDEAQHLSKEVLEQLRLLSNLETNTAKLLQIILIGQPELGEMLDSYELRQLGQRITLSCHLHPMTLKDTSKYIKHRIHIASTNPKVRFTRSAIRSIYNYAKGIPRLINIACDRALLVAFGLNRFKITNSIVNASIKELAGRSYIHYQEKKTEKHILLLFIIFLLSIIAFLIYKPDIFSSFISNKIPDNITEKPKPDKQPDKQPDKNTNKLDLLLPVKQNEIIKENNPVDNTVTKPIEKTDTNLKKSKQELNDFLAKIDAHLSRHSAIKIALKQWDDKIVLKNDLENIKEDKDFFQKAGEKNEFSIAYLQSDLDLIKKINLPAILEFKIPDESFLRYLVLIKSNKETLLLQSDKNLELKIPVDILSSFWTGRTIVPWKNFLNLEGIISINSQKDSILSLKNLLKKIGQKDIDDSPDYDVKTREAIKEIQSRNNILIDGMVGTVTKIILYNESKTYNIPHISQN